MKTKSLYTLLIDLIFIAVFNIIFFVTGGVEGREASEWIGYIFIHLAYLFVIVTPLLIKKEGPAALGLSANLLSIIYFIVEVIVGVVLILIKTDNVIVPLIIEIVIMGIYGFLILSVLMTNENTEAAVARNQAETAYIRDAASRIQALENQVSDPGLRAPIDRVYYQLNSSPVRTNRNATPVEYEILNTVSELESAVYSGDGFRVNGACQKLTYLINERNRLIRVNQ